MEDRLSASGRPEVQIELAGVVVMDACASWDYDGSAWCRLRLSSNGLAAATNGYSYGTKNCQMLDTLVATDTSDRAFYKYQMVKERFEGSGSGPIKEYGDRADLRNSGVLVIPRNMNINLNINLNIAQDTYIYIYMYRYSYTAKRAKNKCPLERCRYECPLERTRYKCPWERNGYECPLERKRYQCPLERNQAHNSASGE